MKRASNIEDLVMAYPGPAFCCLDDGSESIFNKASLTLPGAETLPLLAANTLASHDDSSAATWRMNIGEDAQRRTMEWIAFSLSPGAMLALGRDVTLEAELSQVLTEARQRYRDLLELSHDFIWETAMDGTFTFVSPHGGFGYLAEELSGQPSGLLATEDGQKNASPFTTPIPLDGKEIWLRCKNGGLALVSMSAHPIHAGQHPTGFRGLCRMIGETLVNAADHPDNLQRVAEHILHPFLSGDSASTSAARTASAITQALSAAGVLIALKPPAAPLAYPAAFSAPPTSRTTEQLLRAISHGDTPHLEDNLMSAPAWSGGEILGGLAAWRRETPFRPEEKQLFTILAEHLGPALASCFNLAERIQETRKDSLTGLANLMCLEETGQKSLDHGMPCTLLVLDIDIREPDLKKQEDILRQTGGILLGAIRRHDLAARIGEKEFAILAEGDETAAVTAIRKRILTSTREIRMPVTLRIGTAPAHIGDGLADLLAAARKNLADA